MSEREAQAAGAPRPLRLCGIGSVALALALASVATTGCTSPPPALPASVMAQGVEAVPEEHPELTEQQLAACGDCHLTSDAPTP